MTSNNFQFDINRADDPMYIFRLDVYTYLLELSYKTDCLAYGFDGSDPEHFLACKITYYEIFLSHLNRHKNNNNLKEFVISIIDESPLPKIYYYTYCVICNENLSKIRLSPCNHHCICSDCYKNMLNYKIEVCPICRSIITGPIAIIKH